MTREEKLVEAIQWCGGSADFNDGGKARKGWLKICAPLLEESAKQTDNKAMPKCSCRGCMNPKVVGICDCCGGIVVNHPALRQ